MTTQTHLFNLFQEFYDSNNSYDKIVLIDENDNFKNIECVKENYIFKREQILFKNYASPNFNYRDTPNDIHWDDSEYNKLCLYVTLAKFINVNIEMIKDLSMEIKERSIQQMMQFVYSLDESYFNIYYYENGDTVILFHYELFQINALVCGEYI